MHVTKHHPLKSTAVTRKYRKISSWQSQGKTFALNCYLTREYAETGIAFDMLEPMGHGKYIAEAFGLPWYVMSAKATCLNPQDVMFPTLIEQKNHTIRIYETVMGRSLSGGQRENLERGLLGV